MRNEIPSEDNSLSSIGGALSSNKVLNSSYLKARRAAESSIAPQFVSSTFSVTSSTFIKKIAKNYGYAQDPSAGKYNFINKLKQEFPEKNCKRNVHQQDNKYIRGKSPTREMSPLKEQYVKEKRAEYDDEVESRMEMNPLNVIQARYKKTKHAELDNETSTSREMSPLRKLQKRYDKAERHNEATSTRDMTQLREFKEYYEKAKHTEFEKEMSSSREMTPLRKLQERYDKAKHDQHDNGMPQPRDKSQLRELKEYYQKTKQPELDIETSSREMTPLRMVQEQYDKTKHGEHNNEKFSSRDMTQVRELKKHYEKVNNAELEHETSSREMTPLRKLQELYDKAKRDEQNNGTPPTRENSPLRELKEHYQNARHSQLDIETSSREMTPLQMLQERYDKTKHSEHNKVTTSSRDMTQLRELKEHYEKAKHAEYNNGMSSSGEMTPLKKLQERYDKVKHDAHDNEMSQPREKSQVRELKEYYQKTKHSELDNETSSREMTPFRMLQERYDKTNHYEHDNVMPQTRDMTQIRELQKHYEKAKNAELHHETSSREMTPLRKLQEQYDKAKHDQHDNGLPQPGDKSQLRELKEYYQKTKQPELDIETSSREMTPLRMVQEQYDKTKHGEHNNEKSSSRDMTQLRELKEYYEKFKYTENDNEISSRETNPLAILQQRYDKAKNAENLNEISSREMTPLRMLQERFDKTKHSEDENLTPQTRDRAQLRALKELYETAQNSDHDNETSSREITPLRRLQERYDKATHSEYDNEMPQIRDKFQPREHYQKLKQSAKYTEHHNRTSRDMYPFNIFHDQYEKATSQYVDQGNRLSPLREMYLLRVLKEQHANQQVEQVNQTSPSRDALYKLGVIEKKRREKALQKIAKRHSLDIFKIFNSKSDYEESATSSNYTQEVLIRKENISNSPLRHSYPSEFRAEALNASKMDIQKRFRGWNNGDPRKTSRGRLKSIPNGSQFNIYKSNGSKMKALGMGRVNSSNNNFNIFHSSPVNRAIRSSHRNRTGVANKSETDMRLGEHCPVKVAVRIRPRSSREIRERRNICTNVTPNQQQIVIDQEKAYTFDYVFDMNSNQAEIYVQCVETLVEGSLHGYNATVLAYGQTGTGKTYTIGTEYNKKTAELQHGIIFRAVEHIFTRIEIMMSDEKNRNDGLQYSVLVQFVELYNEELIDLLAMRNDSSTLKIHEDKKGEISVAGATIRSIRSPVEAMKCLQQGAIIRKTAATQSNANSSRSHALFTLFIRCYRRDCSQNDDRRTDFLEMFTSKLHFVDLAGSEGLKRSNATGERAREGISINCGLLALGNCISALGNKSQRAIHVPYRDSKLTRLLQDSLGGNSQTIMIACVSPSERDITETLNTLGYAKRARNIQNILKLNQFQKTSLTITQLRKEIEKLQAELWEFKKELGLSESSVNFKILSKNAILLAENRRLHQRLKAIDTD